MRKGVATRALAVTARWVQLKVRERKKEIPTFSILHYCLCGSPLQKTLSIGCLVKIFMPGQLDSCLDDGCLETFFAIDIQQYMVA